MGVGPGDLKTLLDAAKNGAVGYIGILTDKPGNVRYYPNAHELADPIAGKLAPIPGFFVNASEGQKIRALALKNAGVRLISMGETPRTEAYNIFADLPGKSESRIQLSCHTDGGAIDDASGVSAILSLARWCVQRKNQNHTVQVVFTAGHFSNFAGDSAYMVHYLEPRVKNVKLNLTVEHLGTHCEIADDNFVLSNHPCPSPIFASSPALEALVKDAMKQADPHAALLPIWAGIAGGEGSCWHFIYHEPSVFYIEPVEYLATTADTMEKYDPAQMQKVLKMCRQIISEFDSN